MNDTFRGSEALASGRLTPYALRSKFVAIYPGVYQPRGAEVTAKTRAKAAWLWSRRQGIGAGRSAAALHGAKWVDAAKPAQLIYNNRHAPPGIDTWWEPVAEDEVTIRDGMRVTTPARTALDIARRYPTDAAVAAIDALANATHLKVADIELLAQRYVGRRGIRSARGVLDLVDPGAESPRETWLRLLVIRHGFPRPQTQVPIYGQYGELVAIVDLGWDDIQIAMDYDGAYHRDPVRFNKDVRRHDAITELDWVHQRVTSRDTEGGIVRRLSTAFARRM